MEIFFLALASVAQDILSQLGRGNAESIILFKRKIEIDKSLFIYSSPLGAKVSYFFCRVFPIFRKCILASHKFSFRAFTFLSFRVKIEISLEIIFSFCEWEFERRRRGGRTRE